MFKFLYRNSFEGILWKETEISVKHKFYIVRFIFVIIKKHFVFHLLLSYSLDLIYFK